MILRMYINGKFITPKLHSTIYADELYEEFKKSNLPGAHIKIVAYKDGKVFNYRCSIRDELWNKKH